MEILKIFVNNGELMGALLKDTEGIFPVKISSLHNPVIFEELLANGWSISKLPYGFEKGTVALDSLPSEAWDPEQWSDQEVQDMEDYDIDLMTSSEIAKRLTPTNIVNTKPIFKEGSYLINTRQEFLDFLMSQKGSKSEQDDATLYTPINTFVHPSARFTIEEYFAKENNTYKEIIESRRRFAFLHFFKVQQMMMDFGLKRNFNSFELVDFYFGWGICGINMAASSSDIIREFSPLSSLTTAGDSKFLRYTTGYATSLGECKSEREEKVKPSKGEVHLNTIVSYLSEPGMTTKDIFPLEVHYPSSENRRVIIGNDIYLEYSASVMRLSYKNLTYTLPTFVVKNPIEPKKLLNHKYWNLSDKNSFFEEMRTRLICSELVERVSVESDATTIGVLAQLGVSPVNAFRYVLSKINLAEVLREESGEDTAIGVNPMYLVEQYLKGVLEEKDEMYSSISEFVTSVLDGTVNVDSIDTGILVDSAEDDNLYHIITSARKYLGLSWDEISSIVSDISLENPTLIFENDTLRIKYSLQTRDARKNARNLDLNRYATERAKTVQFVTRVKYVLKESVPDGYKPRHVAVAMDVIPLQNRKNGNVYSANMVADRRVEEIIKKYVNAINRNLQEHMPQEASSLVNFSEVWVIQSLFEMAEKNCITVLKRYHEKGVIPVDTDDAVYLRQRIYTQVESLLSLTDNVLDPSGRFSIVNVNGAFTPNFFVPFQGIEVETLPFLMSFKNTIYFSPEQRKMLLERNWIPNLAHKGFSFEYKQNRLIPDVKTLPNGNTVDTTGNLNSYEKLLNDNLESFKARLDNQASVNQTSSPDQADTSTSQDTSRFLEMPEDPIYTEYPVLEGYFPSDEIKVPSEMSADPAYCQGAKEVVTRESVLQRSTFCQKIFGDSQSKTQNLLTSSSSSSSGSVTKGLHYKYSDIKNLTDIDDTLLLYSFDDSLERVAFVKNKNEIVFMDGTVVLAHEVSTLDPAKYAVQRVTDSMYIILDVYGSKYTVRLTSN